jgi:hypothetical protein
MILNQTVGSNEWLVKQSTTAGFDVGMTLLSTVRLFGYDIYRSVTLPNQQTINAGLYVLATQYTAIYNIYTAYTIGRQKTFSAPYWFTVARSWQCEYDFVLFATHMVVDATYTVTMPVGTSYQFTIANAIVVPKQYAFVADYNVYGTIAKQIDVMYNITDDGMSYDDPVVEDDRPVWNIWPTIDNDNQKVRFIYDAGDVS